ncbi:MAG: hypothetical protein GX197_02165 [Firmicutes bacterium]|nr:hypothetical protein [Bacillota bacterium]
MKKVLAFAITMILLVVAPVAVWASEATIYVTVSVDGKLEIAAEPVKVTELTIDGAIKAAHAAFYPEGESGYAAGLDPMWNMFMISKVWGVNQVPFVILNSGPLGSAANPGTADVTPVKDGDNLIISVSSNPAVPAQAVSLTVSVTEGEATVTATNWLLDFMTFSYSSAPLANAEVIDVITGEVLGTTDAEGSITVPAGNAVAVAGVAAIPTDGSSASTPDAAAATPPPAPSAPTFPAPAGPGGAAEEVDYSLFSGGKDVALIRIVVVGIILFVPALLVVLIGGRRAEKEAEERGRQFF